MVDRNLFLHDLAIVAIMKCEGPYIKEWLDYHLLAGVEHFYIYDNESPDNQAEVVAPYVEAGLVDYFLVPGKAMQMAVYKDAVNRFKFHCRYMAFIDGDEFIYPKFNKQGGIITEVVDEILSQNPNAAGLAIHWQIFGSNGQERADYSCGVLERFTRRAPSDWFVSTNTQGILYPKGNCFIKSIVNPRKVNFFDDPHKANYFEGFYSVDEHSNKVVNSACLPIVTEKIVVNHYYTKSREEYNNRNIRGRASKIINSNYNKEGFNRSDRNEIFDDGILKYRAARADLFSLEGSGEKFNRVLETLTKILSAYVSDNTPREFFIGKMETALTCRAVSTYLREKFPHNERLRIYEEASLAAILKSLDGIKLSDTRLLISELPNLLCLPYPVVKEIRNAAIEIISLTMDFMRKNEFWKDFSDLDLLRRLLRNI